MTPPSVPQESPAPRHAAPDQPAAVKDPIEPPEDSPAEPHVRLNAQALEGALVNLRKRVAAVPLLFDTPDLAEVKAERVKLLSQIEDYLLPRLRRSNAPILVAVVGSTGAGKST
ncbi:MAG TPA: hypothetical protein VHY31_00370, partial [Streptosporangiaceae bacterium]|nr:hypothetical protein [Streptosporangiaceae bacterium]